LGEIKEEVESDEESQNYLRLVPKTRMDLDLDTAIDIPKRDTSRIVL